MKANYNNMQSAWNVLEDIINEAKDVQKRKKIIQIVLLKSIRICVQKLKTLLKRLEEVEPEEEWKLFGQYYWNQFEQRGKYL